MDASLAAFLRYRVERLREISQQVAEAGVSNLVPIFCDLLTDFCVNRPKSPFFNKAEGSKLIRKDLKFFFPAVFGLDIRPFTTGSRLVFDQDRFERERTGLRRGADLLRALSRLGLLVSTYDLLTVEVEDTVEVSPELVGKARQRNAEFLTLFAEYLAGLLDIPSHTTILKLSKGRIRQTNRAPLARVFHDTVLSWVENGQLALDLEGFDRFFEQACQTGTLVVPDGRLVLDPGGRLAISLKKLTDHPLSDHRLQKTLRYRYHLTTYLFTAGYYRQSRGKREVLFKQVTRSLSDLPGLSSERIAELADFLLGDRSRRLQRRAGFVFDPLPPESGLNWQEWEREAVFLGEKPDDPSISPQHIPLPEPVVTSLRKPVCILLDVSASMSDCLDVAIKSVESLFIKLRHHPVSIVLFSSRAGVLNQGRPLISRGLPLHQEVPWLPKLISSVRRGLFLGGTTSIGNGILLGKTVALAMAEKMVHYRRWMDENGIAAHCILVSDNLHNTPRDISRVAPDGQYLIDDPNNVAAHAARSGCSLHNLICLSPTGGVDRIVHKMQAVRYIQMMTQDYFAIITPGMSRAKAIEKDLIMTVLSHQPRTLLFRYRDQDRFSLVNTWMKSVQLDQRVHAIAGFVVFLRGKIRENPQLYDAFEFISRDFNVSPPQLLGPIINMDRVFDIYQLMLDDSEVVLESLDDRFFDASPHQVFRISHCIAATQHQIFPYSVTPVMVQTADPLDRRKDFENELYFGLKNLERLDRSTRAIAAQIEAMSESGEPGSI